MSYSRMIFVTLFYLNYGDYLGLVRLGLSLSDWPKITKIVHFCVKHIFVIESVSPYQLCTHAYQELLTLLQLVRVITETRKSLP